MNTQQPFRWPSALQVMNGALGLLSLVGGILALRITWEPERYGVSGAVMVCSGLLWLICTIVPQFRLTRGQYFLLGVVFCLGMALGLLYTFNFCGGELACFSYRGYPGRWLRMGQNMYNLSDITWEINGPSLIADAIFWSGVGLILSVLWRNAALLINRRRRKTA